MADGVVCNLTGFPLLWAAHQAGLGAWQHTVLSVPNSLQALERPHD